MSWRRLLKRNLSSVGYTALVGLMPLVFSTGVAALAIQYEADIRGFGLTEWTAFYVGASFTMAFGLTPTTFIALLSGYFAGWGTLFGVLISYLAASLLGYVAASLLDRGRFVASLEEVTGSTALIERLRKGEIFFIILARISPFLPFAIMNVLLAALRVNLRTFLLAGFVGMLPRTLLFIWVGMQFSEMRSLLEEGGRHGTARVVVIVLLVASIAGFYAFFRRYLATRLDERSQD